MKKAFRKNIFRTIKKSMGRYMAILAIIALGVGFFAGLKVSKPAMMKTGEEYIENQAMFDYRLISTWGFNAEEIEQISQLEGVQAAEGAVWEDFIYTNEEGSESCLKALSITEQVNKLTVTAGRLPEAANECVVDAYRYPESMVGQEIRISSANAEDTKDSFVYDTYIVTGMVRTPLYMNMERGTTTIGNGKVEGFIFIPLEGFSYEYFEEVYVTADTDAAAFTEAYENDIEDGADAIEEGSLAIIDIRYEQELADANEEIADAEQELSDGKQELADGKQKIADGKQELADGKQELADARATLEKKEQELLDGEAALKDGEAQYEAGLAEYEAGAAQLEAGRVQYQQAVAAKEQMEAAMSQEMLSQDETYLALVEAVTEFETNEQFLRTTKAQLDSSYMQIEGNKKTIEDGKKQLEIGKQELLEAEKELAEAEKKLGEEEEKLVDAQAELESGEKELADAKKELADVEEPELYVLERSTNVGYASFEGDVSIVEGIAKIFPIFFFLIAALVCSTTMTRMVDDERTQIGTLRALGYSETAILSKYMIYSGTAAGIGAAAGYFAGTRLFPTAIWYAYNMLYGFADLILVDNVGLFVLSILVALLCSAGTTYAACRIELSHAPAELIRPKAPSAGKRILLERMTFIWKHLKFLYKVSARNIFRFKKRMIMMIMGIAGCTALVVAGFGVKDSVSNIMNNQYDQIMKYHINGTYTEEISSEMLAEIEEQFSEEIAYDTVLMETSVDAPYTGGSKTVTLMSSMDDNFSQIVDFHLDDKHVELPGKGEILIDERLADLLEADIGDEITLKIGEEETKPLKVAGVFENYTFFYAYVTGETYQEYFPEDFEPKTLYISLKEGADHYRIASYLSDMETAANISVVADTRNMIENMMQSMNFIVALVIGCAAALAFIVLFNLGNINISERVREIATLKVLGFYPRETGAYVFRENAVLSMMGIIVGLPLGILLHRFVMQQIQIDMISFDIRVKPISFVLSVIAVLGFTVCVDLIMRKKINRINMAESLKSIE